MIKIYYSDISNLNIEDHLDDVSAYRREKLNKSKQLLNKKQGLGAELLLNFAVKEICPELALPLNIQLGQYGKPFCEELPICFSLSHSGNFSACAVCETEIGLDIQKPSCFKENLAKRYFTLTEREYIYNSEDRDKAFTKIWTMKESYIKALGTGLNTAMNSFSVIPEPYVSSESSEIFRIYSSSIENSCFSVCGSGEYISAPVISEVKF